MPTVSLRGRGLRPLAVVPWTFLLASCSLFGKPDNFGGVQVANHTDVTIDVFFADPNASERPVLSDLPPHKATNFELFSGGGCDARGTFVARAPDGAEVDRLDGPFCQQMTWIVEAPSPNG